MSRKFVLTFVMSINVLLAFAMLVAIYFSFTYPRSMAQNHLWVYMFVGSVVTLLVSIFSSIWLNRSIPSRKKFPPISSRITTG